MLVFIKKAWKIILINLIWRLNSLNKVLKNWKTVMANLWLRIRKLNINSVILFNRTRILDRIIWEYLLIINKHINNWSLILVSLIILLFLAKEKLFWLMHLPLIERNSIISKMSCKIIFLKLNNNFKRLFNNRILNLFKLKVI
jgi:hypothetical protein